MRAIEFPAEIEEFPDLEVAVIEKWTYSIAKINRAEKRDGKTVLCLTEECAALFFDEKRSTKMDRPLCAVQNSLEFLNSANEWYFDAAHQTLYFQGEKGVDVNAVEFTVPALETLVDIRSDHVFFENVTFAYSNWGAPSEHGFAEVQGTRYLKKEGGKTACSGVPSAVTVSGNQVCFHQCSVYGTGASGMALHGRCDGFSIIGCNFSLLGAGGIVVGTFEENGQPPCGITIVNNTVRGFGKSYLGGVGILAGYTKNLLIDHNTVEDGAYTGISVGWGWGMKNQMQSFQITNNRVYNVINNHLFDGAGLYLLGRQEGDGMNRISGNVFEGGNGYAGLYFDEFAGNYIATDNVITAGKKGGCFLLIHAVNYGNRNIIVKHNFIDTKKKHINSYKDNTKGYQLPNNRKSLKNRNIVIRENYTPDYKNYELYRALIVENSGAKR